MPDALTQPVSPSRVCMNGTGGKPSRCTALLGTVGQEVRCTVYDNRPSPCREFNIDGELGVANADCNRARAGHGLEPIHWVPVDQPQPDDPEFPQVV